MRVRVFSPHRDDAAFCCGLLMSSLLRRNAELSIVNVCTVSAYAPYLSSEAALRDEQRVTQVRASEDANFVRQLAYVSGTTTDGIGMIDLGWKDAPLRRNFADEQVLVAPVDKAERRVLSSELAGLGPADLFLIPAGIGNHTDHLLVRDAALATLPATAVLLYEDLPYAARQSPSNRTHVAEQFIEWLPPVDDLKGLKRNFALHYPSQVASSVADELESYAVILGGRERFYGNSEAGRAVTQLMQPEGVFA